MIGDAFSPYKLNENRTDLRSSSYLLTWALIYKYRATEKMEPASIIVVTEGGREQGGGLTMVSDISKHRGIAFHLSRTTHANSALYQTRYTWNLSTLNAQFQVKDLQKRQTFHEIKDSPCLQ